MYGGKINQGQGVQRTTSALLKLKLKFFQECQTACPEDREPSTIKGYSIRCYSHCMREQLENEAISSESPWSCSLGRSQQCLCQESEQFTFLSHLKPGHHHSQAAAHCPPPKIVMISASALFTIYYITASRGGGKIGYAEGQQQQFMEILCLGMNQGWPFGGLRC